MAKLVKKYKGRVKINGTQPHILSYDLGNYYSADKVTKFLKQKIEKIPNNEILYFASNAKYRNLNNKFKFSGYTKKNKFEVFPVYLKDSSNSSQSRIRFVMLYIMNKNPKPEKSMFKVGLDKHNDCLFNAIYNCFDRQSDLLSKQVNTAKKLKIFLGYKRDDMVDLTTKNFKLLEEVMKCSFIISGDYQYSSCEMKKFNISLHVKGEHITPKFNKDREMNIFPRKKEDIYFVKFDGHNIILFNGQEKQISDKQYSELKEQSKNMLIECKLEDDFKVVYKAHFDKVDQLIISSKGIINYYKSQYPSVIGYDIWKQMTKYINTIEELDDFEHIVINYALHGGIHYSKSGTYNNVYDIDMNSAYMHYMSSLNFNIPVTKPNYKTFLKQEFNELKFFSVGYYLVKFINTHDYFSNFKTGIAQWVTQNDLRAAKVLEVKYEIIENQTNALLYESKQTVKGSHVFDKYCNFLYKLKKSGEDVKDLTVSIWGVFATKNYKRYRVTGEETVDLASDEQIDEIYENSDISMMKTVPISGKIFKYSMARFTPFLTSYTRLKMIEVLVLQPKDTVLMINTDGFISSIPRNDLTFSDEMGNWKKYNGNCIIENSMNVKWLCPKCDEYVNKKHTC